MHKGSSLLTYFADASNEEKQAVMIIIKPMPNSGEFITEDSVRLSDIGDWFSFSTCNLEEAHLSTAFISVCQFMLFYLLDLFPPIT